LFICKNISKIIIQVSPLLQPFFPSKNSLITAGQEKDAKECGENSWKRDFMSEYETIYN